MNIIVRNKRTYKGPGEPIHRPSPKGQAKGSVLGNPFYMTDESERDIVVAKYKLWLWNHVKQYRMMYQEGLDPLTFKDSWAIGQELDRLYLLAKDQEELNLICWCAPKACHGDVIKAYLEWRYANDSKESQ